MNSYYLVDTTTQQVIKVSRNFEEILKAESKQNKNHKLLLGTIPMKEDDTRNFIKEKIKKGAYKEDEETHND